MRFYNLLKNIQGFGEYSLKLVYVAKVKGRLSMKCLLQTSIVLVLLFSCSDTSTSTTEGTFDDQWTPEIQLLGTGYERFRLQLNTHHENVLPYIDKLIVRAIYLPDSTMAFFDVLSGEELFYSNQYTPPGPVLSENTEYEISVTVQFLNGSEKNSNTINVLIPPNRGSITSSLKIPDYWQQGGLTHLSLQDSLICRLYRDEVFIYNMGSGSIALDETDFGDLPYRFGGVELVGEMEGDFIIYARGGSGILTINRFLAYNPTTGTSTQLYDIPDTTFSSFVAINSEYLLSITARSSDNGREMKFTLYNSQTGDIARVSPYQLMENGVYEHAITLIGDKVWMLQQASFNNRLKHFDPESGTVLADYHVPVYAPSYLVFDDNHFWTLDQNFNSSYSTFLIRFVPSE